MLTRTNTQHELHIEFAMWRQTFSQTRFAFMNGHMSMAIFVQRLTAMGFQPHEISAEVAYMADEAKIWAETTLNEKELQTDTAA